MWMLALGLLCALLSSTHSVAFPQQASPPTTSDTPDKKSKVQNPTAAKPATAKSAQPKSSPPSKSVTKPRAASPHTAAAKRRKRPMSPRVRRIRQAFVASTTLRPMAQQLIQDRTPAGYAGVEAYARSHSKEDAGALAWLVLGYAHILDHDCPKAIDPLNRAKPLAGDLGDYVAYYLGTCYLQTGHQSEGLAALANFDTTYPDSLLIPAMCT